jgi:hypothetical protein
MKQIMTCMAVLWLGLGLGYGEELPALLDRAAGLQRDEYLAARDAIVDMGQDVVVPLRAIRDQADAPWQRRVMAGICLERIEHADEIQALQDRWAADPVFAADPNKDNHEGPVGAAITYMEKHCIDGVLRYHALQRAWKGEGERPPFGNRWEEWIGVDLEKKNDPELLHIARDRVAHSIDKRDYSDDWFYKYLVRVKDHESFPLLFNLWWQSREFWWKIAYNNNLRYSKVPTDAIARQQAADRSTYHLAMILPVAEASDYGWLKEKLEHLELGDDARKAWIAYQQRVGDTTAPVIAVVGDNPVTMTCGLVYTDAGATATDNKDGNLTGSITTTTTVNTDTVGTYAVTYSVKDAVGNEATAVRTVEVHYSFDGFLAPIGGADASGGTAQAPVKTFKAGSKIPVKFTIGCGIGLIHEGVHTLQVVKWNNETTAAEPIDASPADAATEGNQFRWADDHWHYILDTQSMNMGVGVWELRASLHDGSKHSVFIGVK